MLGYCVKCNRGKGKGQGEKVEVVNPVEFEIETRKGRKRIVKGTCPKCGSPITVIVGK